MNALRDKLYDFETPPPEGVWDRVQPFLDADPDNLSERLKGFQSAPPAGLWNKIEARLTGEKARVVPFYRRFSRPLRYGAVAAVFVLVAVSSTLLMNKKVESAEVYGPVKVVPGSTAATKAGQSKKRFDPLERDIAVVNSKSANVIDEVYPMPGRRNRISLPATSSVAGSLSFLSKLIPRRAEHLTMPGLTSRAEKYMVYNNDEGTAVRLPKKLFDAVACPQRDPDCRENLRKMQAKFASSSTTAGFGGMLDILANVETP